MYLDDIFIYTDNDGDGHIKGVLWVPEQLKKFLLYANLKKCQFYQKKVWFFRYVLSLESIRMEDKKIKAVKKWLEPRLVRDI